MDLTLKLTLPWSVIAKEYEHQLEHTVQEAELPGFRKGKAPRDLVEPKLDKTALYSRCLETLLPKVYSEAVKRQNLKPILYPKIKVVKGEVGQDWEFEAVTCEAPKVTIPDLKSKPKATDVFKWLLENSKVDLPPVLIEEETSHRLASLTDNLTRLGMTTENYLSAKKTTAEDLKATLKTEVSQDLTLEFILQEVGRGQNLADRTKVLDYLKTL